MMIRPLIKEDIEVAHKLLSRAFNMAAKRTRQDLQEWLTCPDEVIGRIAVVGDRFAGIVMARRYEECDGLTISPYCLAVLESFWGQGIGHALMAAIEADTLAAWQYGRSGRFYLNDETKVKNSDSRFYETQGYRLAKAVSVPTKPPLMFKPFF